MDEVYFDVYGGCATKLLRLQLDMIQTLDRHRPGNSQTGEVRNVHIYPGAQGVVGIVNPPKRRRGTTKNDTRPHASGGHCPPVGELSQSAPMRTKTRTGHPCRQAAVRGRARCRMHGGAKGSGGPQGNRNGTPHKVTPIIKAMSQWVHYVL